MLGDFPFSHSPASSLLRLWFSLSSAQHIFLFWFLSHSLSFLLFLVSLSAAVVSPSVQGGFPPPDRGSIYRFCALVCHLVSRQRPIHSQTDRSTTCSSIRVCPSVLRLRCTTCQPAVFLKEERSK